MSSLTYPHIDTGVVYCDDNLERLRELPAESVDLVYLDPPFFSNRNYEVIWGDEAEVRSFEDRWEGGIQVYINWMQERMEELHRVLKDTGSLYLHCDWHAAHYLKVMLDKIFDPRTSPMRSSGAGRELTTSEADMGRSTTRSSSTGRVKEQPGTIRGAPTCAATSSSTSLRTRPAGAPTTTATS
jgi:hypothetical protein